MVNKILNIPSGWNLLKRIPRIIFEWKLMSPKQKWCYLYGIYKTSLMRFPFYGTSRTEVHWFSYFILFYSFVLGILMLYTFYYYLPRGDLLSCFPCTCLIGILTATVTFLYNFLTKEYSKMTSLSIFGGLYIYQDSDFEDGEYNKICSNRMDISMKSYLTKVSVMALSGAVAIVLPTYAYLAHGIRTTTLDLRIPFTEENSDAEFTVNIIFACIVALHGGTLYFGIEAWMSLVESVVNVMPAIFGLELKRICEQFKSKSISELEMRLKFRNLVKQSIDADNYVTNVSNVLFYRTWITPIAFTYTIGMSIFCQYNMDFAAGYGMAGMSWVQLYYICELGENIQDNGLAEILYDIEWEVLPLDIQKVIAFMIQRNQNVSGIKLGPFGAGINRDMFKICTNKIYTFIMFLIRFSK